MTGAAPETAAPDDATARVRVALLDPTLQRAVASGRRRGLEAPPWRRIEVRPVDLRSGPHLQVVRYDATQAYTENHALGDAAAAAVDALLAEPFGNWHVSTTTEIVQWRVTKKGRPVVHVGKPDATARTTVDRSHDRSKNRLLPEDDPLFAALGLAGRDGRILPSRQAKYRQIEEFVGLLDVAVTDAVAGGQLREPTADNPLRIVDLGCGNGYLTFAAHRYLSDRRSLAVRMTGIDVKEQSRQHNTGVASELGIDAEFVVGTIAEADLDQRPDVVLALHACDTATDEALARALEWRAPLILAAPCCHHDIAAQMRKGEPPAPYGGLVRDGILRERFADTLTDTLRALLLRAHGYRVEVVQFVDSRHTPRNTLLRAVRTGRRDTDAQREYDDLCADWGLRPRLGELLTQPADAAQ